MAERTEICPRERSERVVWHIACLAGACVYPLFPRSRSSQGAAANKVGADLQPSDYFGQFWDLRSSLLFCSPVFGRTLQRNYLVGVLWLDPVRHAPSDEAAVLFAWREGVLLVVLAVLFAAGVLALHGWPAVNQHLGFPQQSSGLHLYPQRRRAGGFRPLCGFAHVSVRYSDIRHFRPR